MVDEPRKSLNALIKPREEGTGMQVSPDADLHNIANACRRGTVRTTGRPDRGGPACAYVHRLVYLRLTSGHRFHYLYTGLCTIAG